MTRPGRSILALGAFTVLLALSGGAHGQEPARPASAYGWPVKPFDRQHPIRGNFGDPRTTFFGPPTAHGLMTSSCSCSFHQGIDISAPDGTAVFPVASGTVNTVTATWVEVDSGGGRAFVYQHIAPLVRLGERVATGETVLGRIRHGMEHVHLTELLNGLPVAPLAPGHLGPYADPTVPRVTSISFRAGSDTGPVLLPEFVHGTVEIVAAAEDTQSLLAPGKWRDLPLSPAKLTYRIERLAPKPEAVVDRESSAWDVSAHLPASPSLWSVYARGTHMNMPNFGSRRFWLQPGVYLFKLTPAPFPSRWLRNGVYRVTVTTSDSVGNQSSTSQLFSVRNT